RIRGLAGLSKGSRPEMVIVRICLQGVLDHRHDAGADGLGQRQPGATTSRQAGSAQVSWIKSGARGSRCGENALVSLAFVGTGPVSKTGVAVARFGVIDRSVERSPCARRCRRTDARNAARGS